MEHCPRQNRPAAGSASLGFSYIFVLGVGMARRNELSDGLPGILTTAARKITTLVQGETKSARKRPLPHRCDPKVVRYHRTSPGHYSNETADHVERATHYPAIYGGGYSVSCNCASGLKKTSGPPATGTQHIELCSGPPPPPEHSTLCCVLARLHRQNTAQRAVFQHPRVSPDLLGGPAPGACKLQL